MFGWENPVGEILSQFTDDPNVTVDYIVIGVVKDFHYESLRENIGPLTFRLARSRGFMSIRIKTDNIPELKATIDNYVYRGSLANMEKGGHILGITKAVRREIGKSPGDTVKITIELDTEERVIQIPQDLEREFKKYPITKYFLNSLSFTNRKEYVQWIESAKKEETRKNRIQSAIEKLSIGHKNPFQK